MTMRAAVIEAPQQVVVKRVAKPEPAPGEVLIALEGCGICGSEVPAYEGRRWFDYPLAAGAPGHEGWGRVEAVGEAVQVIAVGDRVAALSYRAHAEYDVAPAGDVVAIPASIQDAPFPGEALGCAMNVFERSDIQRGQVVAIVGIGFLGALLTQLAAQAGATVVAISRRGFALEVARAMGATEALTLDDRGRVTARIGDLTSGRLCERVIEAVGRQEALDLASELTATRGRLIIAGYHQDGTRNVNMQLWNWRGIDVVNAHERDPAKYVAGMRAAAVAIEAGQLDPSTLYTHTFALDQLDRAFQTAIERPHGFLKAVSRSG